MRTNLADVFAAGDCVETYHRVLEAPTYISLGTIAHKQGRVAGENAIGGDRTFGAGALGTQSLKQNAQRNYGVVIYDTPAALESADAYVVASRVGAAILAARRHRTRAKDISKISRALEGFQCDIAGTILARF